MAKTISVRDFKSYRQADLPLSALTILVGANASGKSNIIEALRLIAWIAQGQKLSALQYLVNSDEKVVRGRIADLPLRGQHTFTFSYQNSASEYGHLEMEFEVREDEALHIRREVCSHSTESHILYETVEPAPAGNSDIRVAYNNFARGRNNPQIICSDQQAVFLQMGNAARFADAHAKSRETIPETARSFERELANILFLDPVPVKMREYSFRADKRLMGDGRNLSSVLYDLCLNGDGIANKKAILSFIKSLPEQDIADIGFLEGPRGEVMVTLTETFGGHTVTYDAGLLSDGTLRVLAIAAALLSAPEGSIVVVEEIDNGVHPSRASKLLAEMNEITRRKNLTLLLTSHNPALLNALPPSAVPDVVFCFRDPQDGYSRLMRISDLPDYPELLAQGALGDLMSAGILERFIKYHPGEEEKMRQALQWLSTLTP
jgi:predicted ATPase